MNRSLVRAAPDLGLLLLRLSLATVFLFHGSQKLFGLFDGPGLGGLAQWLGGLGVPMPQVSALLAALAEFVGGLALLTGLLFRPAMVPLCFTMFVAAFVGHGGKGFDVTRGGLEYPLTLMFAVAALFCTGPGRYVVAATTRAQEAPAS